MLRGGHPRPDGRDSGGGGEAAAGDKAPLGKVSRGRQGGWPAGGGGNGCARGSGRCSRGGRHQGLGLAVQGHPRGPGAGHVAALWRWGCGAGAEPSVEAGTSRCAPRTTSRKTSHELENSFTIGWPSGEVDGIGHGGAPWRRWTPSPCQFFSKKLLLENLLLRRSN